MSKEPQWLIDLRAVVLDGSCLLDRLNRLSPEEISGIPDTSTHEVSEMGVVRETVFSQPRFDIFTLMRVIGEGKVASE